MKQFGSVLLVLSLIGCYAPAESMRRNSNVTGIRIAETCFDMPLACGAVYSPDGLTMALLSPTQFSENDQVYRMSVKDLNDPPELVSGDENGQPADGICHSPRFLQDGSLIFICTATNLVVGTQGEVEYVKRGNDPIAVYLGGN